MQNTARGRKLRPFVIISVSVWATKVFSATTTTSLIGHYYFVIAPCKPRD